MRKILKIAKLELSILFYSPIAWLVLAIFMVQCGYSFLNNLQAAGRAVSLGLDTGSITLYVFGGNTGLFSTVPGNLYLYLPILTMGLMARETSSGSIKLLLSSPVKLRQIILGKYLAIIGFGLVLSAITGVYSIIGISVIDNVDLGIVISGFLSVYLLICAYAAIGLFMSCLTTYQVVAAISTLAVFATLRYVGTVWQNIDFVRDLTYFLSISGRTQKMTAGLITTKDLFYYAIIIVAFLLLSMLLLKGQREVSTWAKKIGRVAAVICCSLLLGYITSRPGLTGYLDVTKSKSLTLTPTSQRIAAKFREGLKITSYANMLDQNIWAVLPESRNQDLARMEAYDRFIPGLEYEYTYFYHKPLDTIETTYRNIPGLEGVSDIEKIADKMSENMDVSKSLFLPPNKIEKLIDLSSESYGSVKRVEYKGKTAFLRYFNDMTRFPSEAEVMAGLERLLIKIPKLAFLTGNNERTIDGIGDRHYQKISAQKSQRMALINQGFDVDTVNIDLQKIGDDIDILAIADPSIPFTTEQLEKINAYIKNGGNVFITGEPARQDILNPLLKTIGLQYKPGILYMPDKEATPGFINAEVSGKMTGKDKELDTLIKYKGTVAMQGASAIEYSLPVSGFTITPLLMSPAGGWNRATEIDPTVAEIDIDTASGDVKGVFPIAVTLTREVNRKKQQIVVSGDADFISNGEFSRAQRGYNKIFMNSVFRGFTSGKFPVDVSRPAARDLKISLSKDQIKVLLFVCKGIIPALIAIIGTIVLIRRRRK